MNSLMEAPNVLELDKNVRPEGLFRTRSKYLSWLRKRHGASRVLENHGVL